MKKLIILLILGILCSPIFSQEEKSTKVESQISQSVSEAKYTELQARYERLRKQALLLRQAFDRLQRENRLLKRRIQELENGKLREPGQKDIEEIERKIEIKGSDEFVLRIKEALDLLEEKAPDAYKLINKYEDKIEQEKVSGSVAYKASPQINLSEKTAFYSLTWCASVIAHEAYHSKLYHDYKEEHSGEVPREAWGGTERELECIKYQTEVSKKIGAPKHEIDYLKTCDGTHWDLNNDGKRDKKDIKLQDW